MIRFVDLRASDIAGCRFAFWNTKTDSFIPLHGYAWETWEEFESELTDDAFAGLRDSYPVERFKGLCPRWVFEAPPADETCFHCGSSAHEAHECTLTVAETTKRAWCAREVTL